MLGNIPLYDMLYDTVSPSNSLLYDMSYDSIKHPLWQKFNFKNKLKFKTYITMQS